MPWTPASLYSGHGYPPWPAFQNGAGSPPSIGGRPALRSFRTRESGCLPTILRSPPTVLQAGPEDLHAGSILIRGGSVVRSLAAICDYCWTTASEPEDVPRSADGVSLTEQQLAVLRMLAAGAKASAIARSMGVSTRTITRLVSELTAMLGASSRSRQGCGRHGSAGSTPADRRTTITRTAEGQAARRTARKLAVCPALARLAPLPWSAARRTVPASVVRWPRPASQRRRTVPSYS